MEIIFCLLLLTLVIATVFGIAHISSNSIDQSKIEDKSKEKVDEKK